MQFTEQQLRLANKTISEIMIMRRYCQHFTTVCVSIYSCAMSLYHNRYNDMFSLYSSDTDCELSTHGREYLTRAKPGYTLLSAGKMKKSVSFKLDENKICTVSEISCSPSSTAAKSASQETTDHNVSLFLAIYNNIIMVLQRSDHFGSLIINCLHNFHFFNNVQLVPQCDIEIFEVSPKAEDESDVAPKKMEKEPIPIESTQY